MSVCHRVAGILCDIVLAERSHIVPDIGTVAEDNDHHKQSARVHWTGVRFT